MVTLSADVVTHGYGSPACDRGSIDDESKGRVAKARGAHPHASRGTRAHAGAVRGPVGISAAYTSFIERGAKPPSLEVLIGIAEVLDVSLSELFLDADREPPKELARLTAAIAGQPIGIQRRIFGVVEEMLGAVRELKC